MFLTNLHAAKEWFEVMQTTERSQTAVMSLQPGEASGEAKEDHPRSDQVLLVMEGEVIAEIAEEKARMRQGDVVIVPAGVKHRFKNDSHSVVRTFSVYAPPAYPPGASG
jgi:mannose-6-phosphate isomerase-like protein (cupin superfamily)